MLKPSDRFQELVPHRVKSVLARLESQFWHEKLPADVFFGPLTEKTLSPQEAEDHVFTKAAPDTPFGKLGGGWEYQWMRVIFPTDVTRPDAASLRYLLWECDGEGVVYVDGTAWAGLDVAHRRCRLPDHAQEILIEMATYQTAIWTHDAEIPPDRACSFRSADVAFRDDIAWETYWDLAVLYDLLLSRLTDEGAAPPPREGFNAAHYSLSPYTRKLLVDLDKACDLFDQFGRKDPTKLKSFLSDLYGMLPSTGLDGLVNIIGHAHLDLVWLWPEEETYRKAEHTFSTVLRLMEEYPEFLFQHSSPLLYRKLDRRNPEIAQAVRERADEGRWERSGAMELESDVLLTSGEGLTRSLFYGQQFFKENNGEYSRLLWLPDVFGYPACLPQVMRLAGVRQFYSTKLYWSSITRFPHTLFRWVGPDTSEVVAYLSPVGYDHDAPFEIINRSVKENRQAGTGAPSLLAQGWGDGGGGPTDEMCERLRRLKNLAGAPQVSWKRADETMEELWRERHQFPTFQGELYLECHRGTATSQKRFKSAIKRLERETLLLEGLHVIAGLDPLPYASWERLLFSQFHDAVPGSSIGLAFSQLQDDLEGEMRKRRMEQDAVMDALGTYGNSPDTDGERGYSLFNPLPQERLVTSAESANPELVRFLLQRGIVSQDSSDGELLFQTRASGFGVSSLQEPALPPVTATKSGEGIILMSNEELEVSFDPAKGTATVVVLDAPDTPISGDLIATKDHPAYFDAWDVDQFAGSIPVNVAVQRTELVESGPIRGRVDVTYSVGNASSFVVHYDLHRGERCLRLELSGVWQEKHTLLQYSLETPETWKSGRLAEAFGSIRRNLNLGTRETNARWEETGNLWAAMTDESERHGVAIASEASYGFHREPGNMRLSLLRGPVDPDPGCDEGPQRVRFCIAPYSPARQGHIPPSIALPEQLYAPHRLLLGESELEDPFTLETSDTVLATVVTPAHSVKGFLLRLHEYAGITGSVHITLRKGWHTLFAVDFLEDPVEKDLEWDESGTWNLRLAPREIVTLLVPSS